MHIWFPNSRELPDRPRVVAIAAWAATTRVGCMRASYPRRKISPAGWPPEQGPGAEAGVRRQRCQRLVSRAGWWGGRVPNETDTDRRWPIPHGSTPTAVGMTQNHCALSTTFRSCPPAANARTLPSRIPNRRASSSGP